MPRSRAPLLLVALVSGCASPCEEASEKIGSCREQIQKLKGDQPYFGRPFGVDASECSGMNECNAECVNDASCDDIAWVMVAPSAEPNRVPPPGAAKLSACLDRCMR